MKRFIITSPKMKGHVGLVYKEDGLLGRVEMLESEMTIEQLNHFVTKLLPLHADDVRASMPKSVTVTEGEFEITFEMFYDKFAVKRNLIDAKALWAKMGIGDKLKAFMRINAYNKYCSKESQWYKKMYPDTWLRKRHYEDEWETM